MRHSIATVSLSGSLERKLEAAAEAGFDGVEVFDPDLTACPLSPEQVRGRCDELGLRIELFQPFRDGEGVPADAFAATTRRFRHKLALMDRLGVADVLVCSNVNPWAIDDLDASARQVRQLGELAARQGATVHFEALAWGTHVNRLEHAWEVVRRAAHPSVKLTLDTFHLMSRGDDERAVQQVAPGCIGFVQVADAPRRDENVLAWSRHHRCFPGQGDFDVAAVVSAALDNGYDGPLSLEVFSDIIREASARDTALDARRSLLHLEEELRTLRAGAAAAGQQPDTAHRPRIELVAPAPLPAGVAAAFVEVATDEPQELGQLLDGLGLRRAGSDEPGTSELWEDGAARIVVSHGPQAGPTRIAALGVAVDDLPGFRQRASDLLWQVDERDDAALTTSPSGVVVRAVQGDDWTSRFGVRAGAPSSASSRVDHVGYPVRFSASDAELSYWRTLFGLRPGAVNELNHLRGWMRSRTVGSGTPMQVVLNVVEGAAPQARGRVDQVALAVPDLVERVTRARASGVAFLDIPENYYDDLDARFDLGEQRLAELRAARVMYDRDAHGEFLHAYTRTIPQSGYGSFYVELVQRLGDYRGFGAANTPVRLVAQERRDG